MRQILGTTQKGRSGSSLRQEIDKKIIDRDLKEDEEEDDSDEQR